VSRKRRRPRRRARQASAARAKVVLVDPEPSAWIEWGGIEKFVIGYAEGGAPYGLTREEYERDWEDDEWYVPSRKRDVRGSAPSRAVPSVESRAPG
jgi:hypothetical protein